MFGHSPESWRALWVEVFGEGRVQVDTELQEVKWDPVNGVSHGTPFMLKWCVRRV